MTSTTPRIRDVETDLSEERLSLLIVSDLGELVRDRVGSVSGSLEVLVRVLDHPEDVVPSLTRGGSVGDGDDENLDTQKKQKGQARQLGPLGSNVASDVRAFGVGRPERVRARGAGGPSGPVGASERVTQMSDFPFVRCLYQVEQGEGRE